MALWVLEDLVEDSEEATLHCSVRGIMFIVLFVVQFWENKHSSVRKLNNIGDHKHGKVTGHLP